VCIADHATVIDETLLARLPTAYAVALRLDAAGKSADEIAVALGLDDPAAARTAVAIANTKLADLRAAG
jgi:hypothetical protein